MLIIPFCHPDRSAAEGSTLYLQIHLSLNRHISLSIGGSCFQSNNFLFSTPFLDLLFPVNDSIDVGAMFKVNESIEIILFSKSFNIFLFMLTYSYEKVISHTCVKRSSGAVGGYIDIIIMLSHSLVTSNLVQIPPLRSG